MSDGHVWQARVWSAGVPKTVVGAGLLVTRRHVITCAHVVAAALGLDPAQPDTPEAGVPLDLPLLAKPYRVRARVIHWRPLLADNPDKAPEDIALLELPEDAPEEAESAVLASLTPADYLERSVYCFGFPQGADEGVRRTAHCAGENARGWVQLDAERGTIGPGFSGTAAWDPRENAAAGLVVAARADQQTAYLIPARTLLAAWPELDLFWRPRNPYRGLLAFRAQDRDDFHGREALAAELAARLPELRLLTLIGASGSGKSSLIQAGIVPRLLDAGGWTVLSLRPGRNPFESLAGPLVRSLYDDALERSKRIAGLEQDLRAGEQRLHLVAAEVLERAGSGRLLLVVDQFEELYTLAPDADRRPFLDRLLELVRADVAVSLLLGLRSDFMTPALGYAPFIAALNAHPDHKLGPLDPDGLLAAIVEPARRLGVRLEPALIERSQAPASRSHGPAKAGRGIRPVRNLSTRVRGARGRWRKRSGWGCKPRPAWGVPRYDAHGKPHAYGAPRKLGSTLRRIFRWWEPEKRAAVSSRWSSAGGPGAASWTRTGGHP